MSKSTFKFALHGVFSVLMTAAALAACGGTKVINDGDTLVFMGDSITQYGKDSAAGYLPLVAKGLEANGVNVTWHGAGHAGDKASDMLKRFQSDALSKNPDVVTILAGVNDCSAGWSKTSVDPVSSPDDVAAMADMTIAAGATPVLFSPTGSSLESFPQSVDDYSEEVKAIALARGVPYGTTHEAFMAYVQDPINPVIKHTDDRDDFACKATCDSLHMDVPGDRIIAIEMLKALGFDSEAELAKAQTAWNTIEPFYEARLNVKITAAELTAIKVAAAKAGKPFSDYLEDLFRRGLVIEKSRPAEVAETSGADIELTKSVYIGFVDYDTAMDCGRALRQNETDIRSDVGSLPRILNSGFLAAIQELPAATEADLPKEPDVSVDPAAFAKSIEFTCSGYTGSTTLSDFPVAIRLAADSPVGFSYADMKNSAKGDELRFADASGRSLSYEIEAWNPNGASLVWVKLPSLTKTTRFKMYYGGSDGNTVESKWTWKADYVGVWHMGEASGTVGDSSGNGLVAVPFCRDSSCQVAGDGEFGQARVNSTPGINTYSGQSLLKVEDSTLLDLGDDFTFSGWINMTGTPKGDVGRIASRNYYISGGNYAPDWELMVSDYTTLKVFAGSATPVTGTIPSAQDTWVHIAGVFNGMSIKVYANGTKVIDETITPVRDSNNKMTFGSNDKACSMGHFVGLFDEFRLRDAVSSADWVKAEYDQSGTAFLSNGGVETSGGQQEDPPQDDPPQDDPHQEDPPQEDPADALLPSGGDDTAAIQSAISGAAAGDVITLGSGVFSVSDELTIGNAVVLKGQGWAKTVIKQTGAGKRVATLEGGAEVQGVTLTGGSISGNGYNGVKGAGVLVKNGTISWCCISNNTATAYNCNGGGVSFDGGQGRIDHSIVANNTVTHATQTGVYGAGIGFTSASGEVVIDTCLVYGNAAATQGENIGGGIFVSSESSIQILNTTVTGNVAGNKAGGIGFGSVKSGSFVMKNCIVVGNSVGGSENNVGFQYSYQKTNVQNGSSYCLFGLADEVIGTASASGDPGFVNVATGDYRLSEGSPAISAGSAYDGIGNDLDDKPFAATPSVGCYEFNGTSAVEDPTFSPAAGAFYPTVDVTIACATDGATIRYTLDGTDPTETSAVYADAIQLNATATIKAKAFADGLTPSEVVSATYTYESPSVPEPPVLGTVTVTPDSSSAVISGSIASLGNNGATACDVYLSLNSDAAVKVVSGATSSFNYTIPGLAPETAYNYVLSISNNASVVLGAATSGNFTTKAKSEGLDPVVGDAAATFKRIQDAIDAASLESPAGTVTLNAGLFEINAQLMVTGGVTLAGQGMGKTVLKQTATARVATLDGGAKIEGVTLTGGSVSGSGYSSTSPAKGAGVLVKNGTISWCCISNNTATAFNCIGGGVSFDGGQGQIDHSIIANNTVTHVSQTTAYGAGIGFASASGEVIIDTCLVYGNAAATQGDNIGGGIFVASESAIQILNTTVTGNVAGNKAGGIGFGAVKSGSFVMKNCIVADNTVGGSENNVGFQYSYQKTNVQNGSSYCLFGLADEVIGTASASGDPGFVNVATGDYRLSEGSPAIGKGSTYDGIGKDLDDKPFAATPSIGCYEFGSVPPPPPPPPVDNRYESYPETVPEGKVVTYDADSAGDPDSLVPGRPYVIVDAADYTFPYTTQENTSALRQSLAFRDEADFRYNASAKIGDTYYLFLGEAVRKATTGDTIELLRNNYAIKETMTIERKSLTIHGNGHVVKVAYPFLDETGFVNTNCTDSVKNVFVVDEGGDVTVDHLTIMGGGEHLMDDVSGSNNAMTPAVVVMSADNIPFLRMDHVTITRSQGGLYIQGGVRPEQSKVYLSACNIVRNARYCGGGLYNKGFLVMADSSLSENRSLDEAGGGAACENQGTMFMNNCVVCNNGSTEWGGAINQLNNTLYSELTRLYLMNTTISGNFSSFQSDAGGGIGIHGSNCDKIKLYAVNSLICNNYYFDTKTLALTDSDIREEAENEGANSFFSCVYGVISNGDPTLENCVRVEDPSAETVFKGYFFVPPRL